MKGLWRGWSRWRKFPDPKRCGYIHAPIGPGVYVLRESTRHYVLFGSSKNVAYRMTSLIGSSGQGVRKNARKVSFVQRDLSRLRYRTKACETAQQARAIETAVRGSHKFSLPT
jgi:hypothetical protein